MGLTIAIIGGGMVGAATAISLAQQGHKIKLIEHQPIDAQACLSDGDIDVRLSALNLFSQKLLTTLGAWQHIEKSRKAPYTQLSAQEGQQAPLLFDAQDINQTHLGHLIENKVIQASMWMEFSRYDIELFTELGQIQMIDNTPSQAKLVFANGELEVDLVIGADGARSQTRQLANIGTTGWQYQQDCMGILIKLDAPQQSITWQQFKATGPVAFLPMQAPYANLIWYHHSDEITRLKSLAQPELKHAILAAFPKIAGDFTIEKVASFPLTRQHANHYVKNRVVLVGDAAHAINPLAGQGVNLGFKDVAQLTASLADETDIEVALKDYERKRRLPNLTMMTMMDACYAGFSNDIAPLKALRGLLMQGVNKVPVIKNNVLKYAIGEYL